MQNKRILVTGGAGFMGSAFIRYCLNDPAFSGHIINLDALTYASDLSLLNSVSSDPRYTFCQADIRDAERLEEIYRDFKFDQIVHFAAETHVDRSIESPRIFFETNVMGTLELLEFVRHNPSVRFHLISTDEVYGALGRNGVFTEESPYQPNSPYSASKAASDYIVRSYVKTYGIFATISHACNNYGPGQYPEKLIPLMITKALAEEPLPIYGKGDQIREWLYVDDHARAICAILREGQNGEVYNISGGAELSNLTLVHTLLERLAMKLGRDKETYKKLIEFVTDRPGHDFRYSLDPAKMQHVCHFRPEVSLSDGLDATIGWYLNHHSTKILTS